MTKRNESGRRLRRKPKLRKGLTAEQLDALAGRVSYEPHAKHKSDPIAYNLKPAAVRGTCCGISSHFKSGSPSTKLKKAKDLLVQGIKDGLVSEEWQGEFPSKVWAVAANGETFEAHLNNRDEGTYHGFPLAGDEAGDCISELHSNLLVP